MEIFGWISESFFLNLEHSGALEEIVWKDFGISAALKFTKGFSVENNLVIVHIVLWLRVSL